LDPVILAFLLPTTLKRYCIQIFAARYFRELARLAKFAKYRAREKKTGFTVTCTSQLNNTGGVLKLNHVSVSF